MRKFLPIFIVAFILLLTFSLKDQFNVLVKSYELSGSPAIGELSSQSYLNRIFLADGLLETTASKGTWFNREVSVPNSNIAALISNPITQVLGENSSEKWIEINLSEQMLYAHEGTTTIYAFPVSSGLPWMPTVTGEFRIWAKITSQRMSGGSIADGTYYNLPNVPFVQYFYKGYGLHGTYWHNDFGRPRSHGCVNLRTEDAKTLFYWTNPPTGEKRSLLRIPPEQSTRVVVHGSTPTKLN